MSNHSNTVLVIDDEEVNVSIIELGLETEGYQTIPAFSGHDGWNLLQQHKDQIKAILLDRMMPEMNGIDFMKKLKADPQTAHIPVIMQTAAAEKEQVVEGIQAGVYYYLTKPYEEDVLLSILKAAINDHANYISLQDEVNNFKNKLDMVKESYFEISKPDEALYLANHLANFCPQPKDAVLGISEILLNAIEHGNLEISYNKKSDLIKMNKLEEEIAHLLTLPEYASRKAHVSYKRDDEKIVITIKDDGKGFDWEEYLEIDPSRATHNHGRGIALSRMRSFDKLEYKGCGNEVECTIYLNRQSLNDNSPQ